MIDQETARKISDNLSLAFDHLREAILLALAGPPTDITDEQEDLMVRYTAAVEEIKAGPGTIQEKADRIAEVMLAITEELVSDEQIEQETLFPSDPDAPLTLREYEQAAVDLSSVLAQDDEEHSVKAGEEDDEEVGPDADILLTPVGIEMLDAESEDGGEVYEPEDEEEEDDFSALFDVDEDEDAEPPDEGSPPAAF